MAKRIVSSSVPIHKVKPMKHGKRKKFLLKRVLDYLKSDNYMFAPLLSFKNLGFCSAPMVSASSPGVNVSEPILVKKKNLLGKVKDYMISDQYLYAPLVDYQPLLPAAISTSSSQDKGSPLGLEKTDKRKWKDSVKKVAEDRRDPGQRRKSTRIQELNLGSYTFGGTTVIRHTQLQKQTVRQLVQQNCHS